MRSPRFTVSGAALSVLALLSGGCAPGAPRPERPVAGATWTGTISSDRPAFHSLEAQAPLFVSATLERFGTEAELQLRNAGGEIIASSRGGGAAWLPASLSTLVESGGELSLVVTGAAATAEPYELRLEELRAPLPGDRRRLAIDGLIDAGRRAMGEPSGDSLDEAVEQFTAAASEASAIRDPLREARALQAKAEVLLWLDRYDEAVFAAGRARDLGRDNGARSRLRAATLATLAEALGQSRDASEEAERLLLQAQALTTVAEAAGLRAGILRRRAELSYRGGDRETARALLEQGIEVCGRGPCSPREEVLLLSDQGAVERFFGHYAAALDLYQRALAVVDRVHDENSRALVLNNLGVVHATRGEAADALTYYREAADLAARVGRESLAARAAGNMGLIFSFLGDLDRALEYSRRSLDLYREIGSIADEARAQMEIGWVRERRGEIDEALKEFDAALSASRQCGARNTEALTLVGRARALDADERPTDALAALDEALPLLKELGDVTGQIEALRARGEALLDLGELGEARKSLENGLRLTVELGDVGREAPLRALLARVARRAGDTEEARRLIERSLDLRESVRAALASPTLRASYQSGGLDDYGEYLDLVLGAGATPIASDAVGPAFEVAERAKARMLVELLSEARVDVERGVPESLLASRGALIGELSSTQLELRRKVAAREGDRKEAQALRERIDGVQERLEAIEWRIRRASPRYADLRYPKPSNVADAQRMLEPGSALLEYSLGEQRSYLFVVTADRAEVHVLAPRKALGSLVLEQRENLESGGRRGRARLDLDSRELYELLLAPAEATLATVDHLIVVPDQELCYVPFESLIDPRSRRSVLERWSIAYAPSATALSRIEQRARPAATGLEFVGFADPSPPQEVVEAAAGEGPQADAAGPWPALPEARREIDAISQLFPARSRAVFFGAEASEAAVKRDPAVRSASRLHFAAHTVIDSERPGYSALVLSPGAPTEDGFLQVHEIFDLSLEARLVVLSGCRTGLGKEVRGEGFIGMTQAFFYAGADALLVSLWPVPDQATADLMVRVYSELQGGAPLGDALRAAKLALLDEDPTLHPFYWSAFVLVGEQA
ncbi:MAG: CHAT domain-containing protein [Thermoanaerobaculia bacterium]